LQRFLWKIKLPAPQLKNTLMKKIILIFINFFFIFNIFSQELKINDLLTFKKSSELEISIFLQKSGFNITCEYLPLEDNLKIPVRTPQIHTSPKNSEGGIIKDRLERCSF
jgi:hypothetical protein